jgi:prevent-host-death family protein
MDGVPALLKGSDGHGTNVVTVGTTLRQEGFVAEIGIKELKSGASRVIDEVAAGRSYVVTKRGRPMAVIVRVEGAEDLVLANAEEFVTMRRRAREAYRRGRSKPLGEVA